MPDVDASVDVPSVDVPSVDVPSVSGGVDVGGAIPAVDVDVSAPSASLDVAGELTNTYIVVVGAGKGNRDYFQAVSFVQSGLEALRWSTWFSNLCFYLAVKRGLHILRLIWLEPDFDSA